jgi:predicted NodU family carbamoyl transferase
MRNAFVHRRYAGSDARATRVDCSASIQTVHEDTNPRSYALFSAFERRTGCPVLLNTSLNVGGELSQPR